MDMRNFFQVVKSVVAKKHDLSDTSWILRGKIPNTLPYNFEILWGLHPDEYAVIKMFDKFVKTPRYQQNYLKSYEFAGVRNEALPLPVEFMPFFDWSNTLGFGTFDQALVNWYEDGLHYIGAHSDTEVVQKNTIMSISLGEIRTFRIRNKSTKQIVKDIEMTDKSYIVMGGNMQQEFTHEVVKVQGNKGKQMNRRINITFRSFV